MVGSILGAIALIGVLFIYYKNYTFRKGITKDLKEDVFTMYNLIKANKDSVSTAINNSNSATSGVLTLTKRLVKINELALDFAISRKVLKGKVDFIEALKSLVKELNNHYIEITNMAVTSSGIKVTIPFGTITLSFTKRSVTPSGVGTKVLNFNVVKSKLINKK